MERCRQQFPKLITIEDWLAKAHPDAPGLPWRSDDGEEVCSFKLRLLEEIGGMLVVLFDAHGRDVVMTGLTSAIEATALALGALPGEMMLLPAPIKMKRPAD